MMWKAIQLLQESDLKVLYVSCNGDGQNRAFFKMHRDSSTDANEPVYCTPNPYALDEHMLYFILHVPHLIKTARNCFANSSAHRKSRHMWNTGKNISWMHTVNLFNEEVEGNLYTKSHLTKAHVD